MATLEDLLNDPTLLKEALAQAEAQGMPMQPGVTAQAIQPSEQELAQAIAKGFQESLNRQKAQTDALRAMLFQQQIAEGQKGVMGNLDVRPFAQALKQYGSATAVIPEQAPQDNTALMLKLREAIGEGEQGLGKQQLDYLRAQLLALREGKAGRQAQQSAENFNLRLRSTINSSEEAKKVRSIGVLNQKLTALENIVNKTGATLTGEEKAKLDSMFEEAKMAVKNSYDLGALTGPDVGVIEGALGKSPTSLAGIGKYAISGGKKGLTSRISNIRSMAVNEGKGHLESLKAVFPYETAMPIYEDLNKKLEVPESEADKIRKELKALKESK